MAETTIQAGAEIAIRIDAVAEDIARYSKRGDDLVVSLKNGDVINVAGFYTPAENGSLHSLRFADETEADVIGLDLMAKAGFEPEQSVKLWQNMAKQGSGGTPQILSSHPVPENRIKKLQKDMPAALAAYQARQGQGALPRCNK